ncbi:porin [Sporomusa acidovorans]|uniref:SLH domain-containing protein n=2 Tax=Sporomusa TaxID=2375 RepID=A0ABZ3J865_SPOA4|nr:porin [Sporomusa acidovorans]OZC15977.1 outer membrane protein alpha precursor [Sporomusa acidovorans DSM 3132]SDD91248.1 S-layer homology domain-containing protein [Sporomusa acidovorans]
MKKLLAGALVSSLLASVGSTVWAATNPFIDVPRSSWAYEAVSKLATDGIISGYGDGTFRGDRALTRYEMAQIVAKAMVNQDRLSAADHALVDKLAAEFANELNHLGVRVDSLAEKIDNVKWGGELYYRYTKVHSDGAEATEHIDDTKANTALFRLEPVVTINNHWDAKARIDYEVDLKTDSNDSDPDVDRIYVEGNYGDGALNVKLGKLPVFSSQGVIMDERVSGAEINFGSKVFKTTLTAGRFSPDADSMVDQYDIDANGHIHYAEAYPNLYSPLEQVETGDYTAVQFDYTPNDKWGFSAGYSIFKDAALKNGRVAVAGHDGAYGANKYAIASVGASYNFGDANLSGLYAKNSEGISSNNLGDQSKAYNIQLSYKGADPAVKNSWGAYAAYRYLGNTAVLAPTFDGASAGQKGYEVGATYTFGRNILGTLLYFNGKNISLDKDTNKVFGQVEFFF